MHRSRNEALARSSLAAALIAAGALIAIPIGPVPVTLQTLGVAIAMLVLSPREAFAAVFLYVALGAMGLPIFSSGRAGVGMLLGPTGGFIAGFLVGSPAGALLRRMIARSSRLTRAADVAAVCAMLACVYAFGWGWFAASTGSSPGEAFTVSVAPFIIPDLLKGTAAIAAAKALRAAGHGDRDTARALA